MTTQKLFISLWLLIFFSCVPSTKLVKGKFTYTNMHSPRIFLIQAINQDPNGLFWGIGVSDFWGFNEFWITKSRDSLSWFPPLFTGISAKDANYIWEVKNDSFKLKQTNSINLLSDYFYRREFYPETKTKYYFSLQNLTIDSDLDGLNDYVELFLYTNPESNDTDGDGKADGFDLNPLATPAKKLKIHEKLHKYIIEYAIDDFMSDQLLIVERFNNKPMEYKREAGYVLSLPPDKIDDFLDKYGYGVPILSTIISDTLKMYKVQFELFVSPEDGWGYDALYDWDRKNSKWIEKKILNNWEAEYTGIPPLKKIRVKDWPVQKNRIIVEQKTDKSSDYKAQIKRMPKSGSGRP